MVSTFRQIVGGIAKRALRPASAVASKLIPDIGRRSSVRGRGRVRGLWTHQAHYPVSVTDPEKLLFLAGTCGGLPAPSVARLPRQTLSFKQARRLTRELFLRGDRAALRDLGRVLFGGGERWSETYENLVVNEGLDHLLDVVLSGGTQDTTWFGGLLAASPTPAAGWTATEIGSNDFVNYDEAVLETWTDGGVSSQSVDNSGSPFQFTIDTNSSTVGGAFLIGTNTKATPAGTVYAAGAFTGGNKSLDDNDTLDVTATFTSADDGV